MKLDIFEDYSKPSQHTTNDPLVKPGYRYLANKEIDSLTISAMPTWDIYLSTGYLDFCSTPDHLDGLPTYKTSPPIAQHRSEILILPRLPSMELDHINHCLTAKKQVLIRNINLTTSCTRNPDFEEVSLPSSPLRPTFSYEHLIKKTLIHTAVGSKGDSIGRDPRKAQRSWIFFRLSLSLSPKTEVPNTTAPSKTIQVSLWTQN